MEDRIYSDMTVLIKKMHIQLEKQQQLIKECHSELQKLAIKQETSKQFETVGKAICDGVNLIGGMSRGDTEVIAQSGLSLISNVASLAGPVGTFVGAILNVLATIYTVRQSRQESLPSQIQKIIVGELKKLDLGMLERKGHALSEVGTVVLQELEVFNREFREKGKCDYKGLELNRLDNVYQLMSELKIEAERKFGDLAGNLYIQSSKDDMKVHASQCLDCLIGYCNIANIYIMVLSLNKTLSYKMGLSITMIDDKLKHVTEKSKAFLGFLSDSELLGSAGWWLGKLHVMELYRKKLETFSRIEMFRKHIDLPPTDYSTKEASDALVWCTSFPCHLEPQFSNHDAADTYKEDGDLFCIVNNTCWPVCPFSSRLDPIIENLEAHQIAIIPREKVGKSGVFMVGPPSKDKAGKVKKLQDMHGVYLIQFSLDPFVATTPVPYYSEKDFPPVLLQLDYAKSFSYCEKFCIVKGEMKKHSKFKLYRFFIEEFDTEKLKKQTPKMTCDS